MYVGLSAILRERNNLEAARRHLARSAELGESAGLPQHPYRWRVAEALLRQAEGDLDGALRTITEAQDLYVPDYFPNVQPVAATRARILIVQGRLDEVSRWQRDVGVEVGDELSYRREYEHITLARLLLSQELKTGSRDEFRALPFLDRLLQAAEQGGRNGSVIELSILLALASRQNGIDDALRHLGRALSLAAPEGYARVFINEGQPMEALLKLAAKRHIGGDYASRLLASLGPPRPKSAMHPDLIEALSERELDVLRLLGSDLSGPEIARELAISDNTMRTHTKNIYEKLGVNSRRAAVSRAEELRLLVRRNV
jgi:LuxR family maltose regulon positive regulatory protein